MKVASYQNYKLSDAVWLPIIPNTWKQIRGRFVMSVNPAAVRLRNLDEADEVSFVPMEAVGENGGLNLDRTKLLDEIGSGYTELEDGDVVIRPVDNRADGKDVKFAFRSLANAKLVLTDKLIAEDLKARKGSGSVGESRGDQTNNAGEV